MMDGIRIVYHMLNLFFRCFLEENFLILYKRRYIVPEARVLSPYDR